MNKTRLVVVVLVLAIIGGLVYVIINKESQPEQGSNSDHQTKTTDLKTSQDKVVNAQQKGKYIGYSETEVASTAGTKLLFFHAPWCPQCRDLDTSIKSSSLPDDLTIFKVDYDTNQALRIKYGVTIQTTIVKINDKGEKIESYVAYDKPNFTAVEQALLK